MCVYTAALFSRHFRYQFMLYNLVGLKHTGYMCISMSQYLYIVSVVLLLLYVSAY